MNRRNKHLIRRNPLHQHTDRRNIRDRIHRTHFMKMNFRHRNTVHMTFRFRNQSIHRKNILLHLPGYGQSLNNPPDILHTTVMMVMMPLRAMLMHRFLFFLSMHRHRNMRSSDPALTHSLFPE